MHQDGMTIPVPRPDGELRADTTPTPKAGRVPRLGLALVLALVVFAVGFIQLYPTFRTAYAYDDMDCLNLAADVLAGKVGYWEAVFWPHNEHLLPLMRIAFHASAAWFGINPVPFRLAVFAAHLATAWLLGLLALRYTGRASGAVAAGLAYVLPCGLSSMMLWAVTAAGMPVGLVGVAGALLALAHRETLGVARARWLAGAGCLFALLSGSGLIPLLAGPLLLDEVERRRAGDRRHLGPFAVFCLIAMGAATLATAVFYTRLHGHPPAANLLRGLPRAGFLLALTPYRYVLPGLGLPVGASRLDNLILWCSLGLVILAPATALFVALWRRGANPLAKVAACTAVGALGAMVLMGAGRWNWPPALLYEADRYFFPMFLPLALLAAAAAASVAERLQGWTARQRAAVLLLCIVALGAELLLHRRALLGRVPFDVFAAHERRFAQLSRLVDDLTAASLRLPPGSPPLSFPDGNLLFPEVHNRRISGPMLLHVIGSEGERLRLAPEPVSERDAGVLNAVFAQWAREIGEPQFAPRVFAGRLMSAQGEETVDFRAGAQEQAVVAGFYAWEGTYRWMGRRGELRLKPASRSLRFMLAAPISQLRAQRGWEAIVLSVTAIDEVTNTAVPLGTVRVAADGPSAYTVDTSPFLSRFRGRSARLVLEADHTWRPSEIMAGSQDPRDLSVIVMAADSAPQ